MSPPNTWRNMSACLDANAEVEPRRGAAALWSRFLREGSFASGVSKLQAGSLLITAASFISSVALARLLGPGEFGLLGLVISVGTTIGLLRRLGQDYAATTRLAAGHAAGDRRASRDALVFYVFMSVLTSVVVLPPAMLLSPWIGDRLMESPALGQLLPLYLVQGFWAVVAGWTVIALQSTRRLGQLVRFETSTSLAAILLPLALAMGGLGVAGVLWGQVAASLGAMLAGFVVYRRLSAQEPLLPATWELLRSIARPAVALGREIRVGLSIAVDKNLVSLYHLAPLLLLGALASAADVGQLRVAISYMAIPAVLLAPASRLLMVDLPRIRATSPERVRPFFVRVTLLGCLATVLVAVPFALGAVWLIPIMYGPDYAAAPVLAIALLLDAATLGLGIAAGPIFRSYDRTDLPIVASILILAVGLPAAYVSIQSFGALGAALAFAGMLLASRLVSYVQCLRIIPR
jgi:O-antigen/teichoic acid export membrane protein